MVRPPEARVVSRLGERGPDFRAKQGATLALSAERERWSGDQRRVCCNDRERLAGRLGRGCFRIRLRSPVLGRVARSKGMQLNAVVSE